MPPSPAPTPGPRRAARPTPLAVLRWVALGAASGVLAGMASWAFLTGLDVVTDTRLDHPWSIWLLPVAGLGIGWTYHRLGGRSAEGNALLLDQIHRPTAWVPLRMAPLVGVGTLVSHLVGASVGREGTALQLSGSLTDRLARALDLGPEDRRILLTAALAGGFGAVFGVPWAGVVFALEVQRVAWHPAVGGRAGGAPRPTDRARPRSAPPRPWWVPTLGRLAAGDRMSRPVLLAGFRDGSGLLRLGSSVAASTVGHAVVTGLGHHHPSRAPLHVGVDVALLARAAAAGVAFGLVALLFVEATDLVRGAARRVIRWAPARPAVGGVLVLVGVGLAGRSYLGLSLPLIDQALAGEATGWEQPALKLAFTALCLGTGFIGGEVTPLFVIGATLGAALAPALGLPIAVGAAIGYVAVFGAAANTPLASTVVALELFGSGALAPALVACVVAYLCSGQRGLYATQLRRGPDGPVAADHLPSVAARIGARRRAAARTDHRTAT